MPNPQISRGRAVPAIDPGRPAPRARTACPARFLRDETGAVTTEFTVLLPFFVLLLVFFADAATLYLTHTEMYNTAREVSRRMATGELRSESDVQNYAASKLFLGQRRYLIDAEFSNNKQVTIVVSVHDASIFGVFFAPLLGRELVAVARAGAEPDAEWEPHA